MAKEELPLCCQIMAYYHRKFCELLAGRPPKYRNYGMGHELVEARRVYRIEMANGKGPYNSDRPDQREIYHVLCQPKPGFNCARIAQINGGQMGDCEREFYKAYGHARYAFDSLDALRKYIPSASREYLKTKDARIVVYDVPVGAHMIEPGHGEVIFDHADKVCELDIVRLK